MWLITNSRRKIINETEITAAKGERIIISWDHECGIPVTALRRALDEWADNDGYLNIIKHGDGTLVLVWSPRWIGPKEAQAAVKEIISAVLISNIQRQSGGKP